MIEYATSRGIPISQSNAKIYSRDENVWHISHEGGELENPWNEHLKSIHVLSVAPIPFGYTHIVPVERLELSCFRHGF